MLIPDNIYHFESLDNWHAIERVILNQGFDQDARVTLLAVACEYLVLDVPLRPLILKIMNESPAYLRYKYAAMYIEGQMYSNLGLDGLFDLYRYSKVNALKELSLLSIMNSSIAHYRDILEPHYSNTSVFLKDLCLDPTKPPKIRGSAISSLSKLYMIHPDKSILDTLYFLLREDQWFFGIPISHHFIDGSPCVVFDALKEILPSEAFCEVALNWLEANKLTLLKNENFSYDYEHVLSRTGTYLPQKE